MIFCDFFSFYTKGVRILPAPTCTCTVQHQTLIKTPKSELLHQTIVYSPPFAEKKSIFHPKIFAKFSYCFNKICETKGMWIEGIGKHFRPYFFQKCSNIVTFLHQSLFTHKCNHFTHTNFIFH